MQFAQRTLAESSLFFMRAARRNSENFAFLSRELCRKMCVISVLDVRLLRISMHFRLGQQLQRRHGYAGRWPADFVRAVRRNSKIFAIIPRDFGADFA